MNPGSANFFPLVVSPSWGNVASQRTDNFHVRQEVSEGPMPAFSRMEANDARCWPSRLSMARRHVPVRLAEGDERARLVRAGRWRRSSGPAADGVDPFAGLKNIDYAEIAESDGVDHESRQIAAQPRTRHGVLKRRWQKYMDSGHLEADFKPHAIGSASVAPALWGGNHPRSHARCTIPTGPKNRRVRTTPTPGEGPTREAHC